MYCTHCGTAHDPGQKFCASCGQQLAVAAVPALQTRVARHIRLLGILWIARGALKLVSAAGMFFFGHVIAPWLTIQVPFLGFLQTIADASVVFLVALALPSIVAGIGLLQCESWARLLTLVLGFLALLNPPFGTALGIYTLWVLLPSGSEKEYQQLARAA
jgi:hypothetical protein